MKIIKVVTMLATKVCAVSKTGLTTFLPCNMSFAGSASAKERGIQQPKN
jgi:hypothetical protein